jgi:hypothetical protein
MNDSPVAPEIMRITERLEAIERRFRSRTRWLLTSMIMVVGVLAVICWLDFRQSTAVKTLGASVEDLQFSDAVNDYLRNADFIIPDIGSIQFLRRGYSITLDSAQYAQDGLVLKGNIGNATQLYLNSLTLNFSARPYPYEVREKWKTKRYIFWNQSEFEIGNAQVQVGTLNPGATTSFSVTIPNIKQTPNKPQIAVWFSGERYLYLGR